MPPQRAAGSREIAVVLLDRAGSADDLSSTAMGRAVWLPLACCSRRSAAVLEWMEGRWLSLRGGSKRSRRSACIMSPASTCVTGNSNRAPSSCLCHVAVRDRYAGLSSSVLCWFGFEQSDTVRKLLGMIICVLVTPSNTSLVPTAITGPRAPTKGARSAAHFLVLV